MRLGKLIFRGGTFITTLTVFVLLVNLNKQTNQNKKTFSFDPGKIPDITIAGKGNKEYREVDLRIIVITYNRPESLRRLLKSLNDIIILNNTAEVEVWIDRSKTGEINAKTYEIATNFKCQIGKSAVFNQTRHVGIYGQWMGTWQPRNGSKEIAIILEDDITVSPHVYTFLKTVHAKYDSYKHVNGYSLQCSMKHGGGKGNLAAPPKHIVFLYPVIGTWGFSPKTENWIRFIEWYKITSKIPHFKPLVPGILPSSWYQHFLKIGKADTMWEMWHIYFAWNRKELTLYPNLPGCQSFTKNWREAGLHHQSKGEDKLIKNWDYQLKDLPDNPIILDVNGKVTTM